MSEVTSDVTFESFGLPPKLEHALKRMKFITPTPIQQQTIPMALEGRDVLGSAQTGTGKTGAFGVPVIAGLMANPEATALIMTPTRELASQVIAAIEPMIPVVDIRTALLIGGEAMPKQMNQLRHNPRLVVGTPGRINDHLDRGSLKLDRVRYLVLDETDRMLDMGFGIQIDAIVKHISDDRQTLLFSATMPKNITKLSAKYMRDPVRVAVGTANNPVAKIKQEMIMTSDSEKYALLLEQLDARKGSVIIFAKTKWGTQKLSDRLNKDGHRADAIHGDLQQRRRDRVIQNFRDNKYRILVATDVAARGLDIPHLAHVINYDIPQAPEDYIHRIGRTARAGAEGEAVSFVTGADTAKWRAIQRLISGDEADEPSSGRRGGSRRGFGGGRKPFGRRDGRSRDEAFGDKPREYKPREHKPREDRPHEDRPRQARPHDDRPREERAHQDRPHGEKAPSVFDKKPRRDGDRYDRPRHDGPRHERPYGEKAGADKPAGAKVHERKFAGKPRDEAATGDKPRYDKARGDKPYGDKPHHAAKSGGKHFGDRAFGDKPSGDKDGSAKPQGRKPYGGKGGKPSFGKPFAGKPRGGKPFGRKAAHD